MNKAVLIDRDDTINRDVPYCSHPEDFDLLPGVAEGIRLLNEHGFKVVVITNQSGIARGYFTHEMLVEIHNKMCSELARYGAHIDAIYYCPHHPESHCSCRKPKLAMPLRAAQELSLDLSHSYVIGDSSMDIQMGKGVSSKTILVSESIEVERGKERNQKPDFVAHTVHDASRWILDQIRAEPAITNAESYGGGIHSGNKQ
ncbi:D-glycero-beta-D-manno-heptose 1,7-bisphosphate 7-phosphatase [Chloroflexota bacterium]